MLETKRCKENQNNNNTNIQNSIGAKPIEDTLRINFKTNNPSRQKSSRQSILN